MGAEGACALGEALKANKTLTELNLWGVQQQQGNAKQEYTARKNTTNNQSRQRDWR